MPAKKILTFDFFKKYFAKNRGKKGKKYGKSDEKVRKKCNKVQKKCVKSTEKVREK